MRIQVVLAGLLVAAAATATVPQTTPKWTARLQEKRQEAARTHPALVFLGDSIMQELENRSPRFGDIDQVWRRYYACRGAIDLGFAGDTTGNALWRVEHGAFGGLQPKLVVVLIGTNDISLRGGADPEEAAQGVYAVVRAVHGAVPRARILVLGLLPREKFNRRRRETNRILADMDWEALRARWDDVGQVLEKDRLPDPALYREAPLGKPLLHPNEAGWARIAAAIEPEVASAMGPGTCRE
jgi:lysophospholipase L1-like esterase